MIGTVMRIGWLSLRRDRMALVLTFVLPVAFFAIFAGVFGAMDRGRANPVKAGLAALDTSDFGREFAAAVQSSEHLQVAEASSADVVEARAELAGKVRSGELTAAVVLAPGFADALADDPAAGAHIELLVDSSNPVAAEIVAGVLQAAVLQVGYRTVLEESDPLAAGAASLLSIDVVDLLGDGGRRPSIAFFAAGIGVMFLLFSLSGRSALLIRERETGVLTRMLASRLPLWKVLVGRWLFLTLLGVCQVTLMFVFGALAFGLELFSPRHFSGFLAMTVVTAAAAAAFGLLLAALCRTRAQLNGLSAVIVLVMSALGGSMFPRFLMPESLQRLGKLTFNAWALDGYQKVFWYDSDLAGLTPQLGMLALLTATFLLAGALLAYRRAHE